MASITLYRIDPTRNMRRYYNLDIQPDLFGGECLIREWGRIGGSSQVRSKPYATREQANTALSRLQEIKKRRGYIFENNC